MTSVLDKVTPAERDILRRHTAKVPTRLGELAAELGLVVRTGTLKPGVSGEIMRSNEAPSGYLIRVSRHEKRERQRFTLAHEITHYLLHRHLIGDGISDDILYRSSLSNSIEAEANRGAADILMPKGLVLERWRALGTFDSDAAISALAEDFGVSTQAMQIRLGV